jgi:16S rRNA C967 or C1407 C5-methylase (RsmB/RsmF family)
MKNTGSIFAFEKDPSRFQTLEKLTKRAGCTSNENASFLKHKHLLNRKGNRYPIQAG